MTRLSISITEEQAEWITAKKQELGVSKGKVIRECINEVKTGDSLLTESVNSGESKDDDRLSSVEKRLESLEETIRNQSLPAKSDPSAEAVGQQDTVTEAHKPGDSTPAETSSDPPATSNNHSAPGPRSNNPEIQQTDESTNQIPSDVSSTPSSRSASPTDVDSQRTTSRSRDDSDDTTAVSSTHSSMEELATNEIDKSDPDALKSHLEASLATDAHAAAVFDCWQLIRDRGTIHLKSLKSQYENQPLGYENRDDWWSEEIHPVLVTLPGIEPPEGNGSFYRFKY